MTTDPEVLASDLDTDEPFAIPEEARRQHLYILGRTGTGKTNFKAKMVLADIARGDGVMVLDPTGDLCKDIIDHYPQDHLNRLIYLDFTDTDYPVPMNLFQCLPGQDKDLVCSEVIGIFKKLYWDVGWGALLEDLLRCLTLAILDHQFLDSSVEELDGLARSNGATYRPEELESHRYNATLREAHDFLYDKDLRQSYYPFLTNDMVRTFWTQMYDRLGYSKSPAEKATREQIKYSSSTTNKLRRLLLNPLLFNITANRDRLNAIDLRDVMRDQSVLIVNLDKGTLGEDNSMLLGSVLLSRLVVATLARSDLPREVRQASLFHVFVDEFQTFATESFKLLLSEARKYGVTLTIGHQHREQLDREMRGATLNCGSIICFRLLGQDAAEVGREFDSTPTRVGTNYERIMQPIPGTESTDGTLFTPAVQSEYEGSDSRGRDFEERFPLHREVPLMGSFIEQERQIANELTQLRNYTAKVRLVNGSHYRIRTIPLPEENPNREEKIKDARKKTQDTRAVPREQRLSEVMRHYPEELRRKDAEEYEAELDERPDMDGPPVR